MDWYTMKKKTELNLFLKTVFRILDFISNISITKDRISNTKTRVENMTRSEVFLTNFEVFGNVVKHCLSCLTYLLNRN